MIDLARGGWRAVNPVQAAQGMFVVNATVWVGLAIVSVARFADRGPVPLVVTVGIALLMVTNAGVMVACATGLGGRTRRWYWTALAILAVNIVLTVTDEVGILDWLTLFFDLGLFGVLILTRGWYGTPA